MSYNVSSWLPLKTRRPTRPLRMREPRDPWVGGQNDYILESLSPICLFTVQLLLATTTIKGRLRSSVTNDKALDCENFLCVILWSWPLTVWPWTVVIHGGSRVMATLPPSWKSLLPFVHELRVITVNVDHVIHMAEVVIYTNFGDHRLRGFWVAEGQIFPFPIDFHRRPYNSYSRTTVRVCDKRVSHSEKRHKTGWVMPVEYERIQWITKSPRRKDDCSLSSKISYGLQSQWEWFNLRGRVNYVQKKIGINLLCGS